jgi:rod shape determining protein RodA
MATMIRKDTLLYKLTQLHWFLLLTIIALAMFGTLILFSAGSSAHDLETGNLKIDASYAIAHVWRFVLMLGVAVVVALLPLRLWAALAYPAYFIGMLLLLGVEVMGNIVNGSQRWLTIGPLTLQPSELMKIAVPIALARFYHQMFAAQRSGLWIHIVALVMVLAPVAFVLKQPDLGTSLMILGTGCGVIFFAGISLRVVAIVLAFVAFMTPVVYFFGLHDYQRERIHTMWDPDADPLGKGYQLQQGMIAVGSGGLAGKGFMEGAQKELEYIPEQHTDFIFTIVAEEFGFAGSVVLLAAWAAAIGQGMAIAGSSRSAFGSLAASGFISTLFLYVGINIGMVIGLLPVVGIPLPLISYGGTAIVTVMIGFGLLMAVHLNRANDMTLRGLF